ncbi:ras-related and estrogen-regulated growth inhibitor-like [Mya arenaria]|uniref:ras-related and estrogen-regulated growth inhibitor-like n=1 Tax=Mya arenaria TaxID=6604 RepID=UPI0022E4F7B3|nr:ras-related and estrogen-regulated growth inhibitor-like [Mya arenaria]XP_052807965.1 ras-related and estrogen-regulated growth inhibitor-like [Mya arenaria]
MSSPIFRRLSMHGRNKAFRVVVLGQNGVGKSAFTVRVITQRFIGDYDPSLANTYNFTCPVDGDTVAMEIRDTAAQVDYGRLESNIKWADAFVLVYAVTDRCSFNECSRLKVLISSIPKKTKSSAQSATSNIPLVLVGNMNDRTHDRMISTQEGREMALEMRCLGFFEISVREERDSARSVICDLYRRCRRPTRRSELQQRLSCPPSINLPTVADQPADPSKDETIPSIQRQRRRRKALYTIS